MVSKTNGDGVARVRAADAARPLPKRFYKSVDVGGDAPPFAILADGRGIKTPMKADLSVPSRTLAEAVATEWNEQEEVINPTRMVLTRLCNTAIDRVGNDPAKIVAELVGFAASDLVCYRADSPQALVVRQQAAWDPVLNHLREALGARFDVTAGVMHQTQPEAALQSVSRHLAAFDPFQLTAVHNITTLTGSCMIAIAVCDGELSGAGAWAAAHVDEDWQIEQWGEDEEARNRRAANRREFDAALRLLELVSG